jgi:hypothetical protein
MRSKPTHYEITLLLAGQLKDHLRWDSTHWQIHTDDDTWQPDQYLNGHRYTLIREALVLIGLQDCPRPLTMFLADLRFLLHT